MRCLCDVKNIKSILSCHGFKFSKSLGQNFIIDPYVCPNMAEACSDSSSSGIIEIGPGIGVLTVELAKKFKKVVSVEIDKRLIPILEDTTSDFSNIKIINSDILKLDLKKLIDSEFKDFEQINICANLPYYITSEIIMYILENEEIQINSLTLMLQKEAAERICASPGTRNAGAISLAVRYYGTPEILFDVGRESFMPAPNVDSVVIRIDMTHAMKSIVKNKKMFFRLVKSAFSQRRKNILNSLSSQMGISKERIRQILELSNVDPSSRAEQLSFEDFAEISKNF
ncbi:MAG: 16S rRNA (adenine(1518)-N(6)/adenine(1519)-N(6))-dimethyltransferase RsmA [Acutalibacteraceae bacterium]